VLLRNGEIEEACVLLVGSSDVSPREATALLANCLHALEVSYEEEQAKSDIVKVRALAMDLTGVDITQDSAGATSRQTPVRSKVEELGRTLIEILSPNPEAGAALLEEQLECGFDSVWDACALGLELSGNQRRAFALVEALVKRWSAKSQGGEPLIPSEEFTRVVAAQCDEAPGLAVHFERCVVAGNCWTPVAERVLEKLGFLPLLKDPSLLFSRVFEATDPRSLKETRALLCRALRDGQQKAVEDFALLLKAEATAVSTQDASSNSPYPALRFLADLFPSKGRFFPSSVEAYLAQLAGKKISPPPEDTAQTLIEAVRLYPKQESSEFALLKERALAWCGPAAKDETMALCEAANSFPQTGNGIDRASHALAAALAIGEPLPLLESTLLEAWEECKSRVWEEPPASDVEVSFRFRVKLICSGLAALSNRSSACSEKLSEALQPWKGFIAYGALCAVELVPDPGQAKELVTEVLFSEHDLPMKNRAVDAAKALGEPGLQLLRNALKGSEVPEQVQERMRAAIRGW
jgi:hypothetical protein